MRLSFHHAERLDSRCASAYPFEKGGWRGISLGARTLQLFLLACVAVLGTAPAGGQIGPEQPASLIVYPYIISGATAGEDTILQLTNTGNNPLDVQCYLENANRHCSSSGSICADDPSCPTGERCEPGFAVTNFRIRLTAQQPIGWRASEGLAELPLDTNEGVIPPLPELPFVGSLRCVAVSTAGAPIDADLLIGHATIERFSDAPEPRLDLAKYAAVGFQAIGSLNDDGRLVLGGAEAEYDGCANRVHFQHRFSPAFPSDSLSSETTLVLLPCGALYGDGRPSRADVIYTVINEFGEQRSRLTPIAVEGLFAAPLSELDATLYDRANEGTEGGRTLLVSSTGGFIGLAIDTYRGLGDPTITGSAARGLFQVGARENADVISTIATPLCTADCNADARVDIAEIVNAVGISLALHPLALCPAADQDGSKNVTVGELVVGVGNLLNGCP